jgi:type II secretory pathway pseudopilin PulG
MHRPWPALGPPGPSAPGASTDDDGFTIVELVAAMTVLMMAVVGLLMLMMATTVGTMRMRMREAAVAEANARMEGFRSADYTTLAVRTTPQVPATYTSGDGITYPVLRTTTGSVTYRETATVGTFRFQVTHIVAGIDDPADGIGLADLDGNRIDYKRVWVELASTSDSGAPFVYTLQSVLHDLTKDPVVQVQGVHVEVVDASELPEEVVADADLEWSIEIGGGAGVNDDRTAEGVYSNFRLAPGLYTCTVRLTASTNAWTPAANPSATSESQPCNVTAGGVVTVRSRWTDTGCSSIGNPGDLRVVVTDGVGEPARNVTVTLTGQQGQASRVAITDDEGLALFQDIGRGRYGVATSGGGYLAATGEACVPAEDTATISLSVDDAPITGAVEFRLLQKGNSSTVRVRVGPNTFADFVLNKSETQTMRLSVPPGTYTPTAACMRADGREDTKVSGSGITVSAGATYLVPGPDPTRAAEIKC